MAACPPTTNASGPSPCFFDQRRSRDRLGRVRATLAQEGETAKGSKGQPRGHKVVRYRHQLGYGHGNVQAVIALEREPLDASWLDLCNEQGVMLCWPDTFDMVAAVSPRAL